MLIKIWRQQLPKPVSHSSMNLHYIFCQCHAKLNSNPFVLRQAKVNSQLKKFQLKNTLECLIYRLKMEEFYRAIVNNPKLKKGEKAALESVLKTLDIHLRPTSSANLNHKNYLKLVRKTFLHRITKQGRFVVDRNWVAADSFAKSTIIQGRFSAKVHYKASKAKSKQNKHNYLNLNQKTITAEALTYPKHMDKRNNKYLQGGEFYPTKLNEKQIAELRKKILNYLFEIGPAANEVIEEALLEYRLDYSAGIAMMADNSIAIEYLILNPIQPHRLYVHKNFEQELVELQARLMTEYKAK